MYHSLLHKWLVSRPWAQMINAPCADRPDVLAAHPGHVGGGRYYRFAGCGRWLPAGQVRLRMASPEMSDTGLTVLHMNEPLLSYDVTVTVNRDGGRFPDPGEYAAAASSAAGARSAETMSAHTAEKIISVVSVPAASRPEAVAVALAVVSEALRCSSR
jgi:hypothetical protein